MHLPKLKKLYTKKSKHYYMQINETILTQGETQQDLLIKLTKIKYKEKILKSTREKQQITYKGTPIKIIANLSEETLQARREWQDKVIKGQNLEP